MSLAASYFILHPRPLASVNLADFAGNNATTSVSIEGKKPGLNGGPHSTVDSILASRPAALGSILGVPKIFS